MPSSPATRIAEPLLGGPDGIHTGIASARFRRVQAYLLSAVLGLITLCGLALQGPCLATGYAQPSASARMCAGPLATAFLGQANPEVIGRAQGGPASLSVLDARLVDLFHLITDDVSVFMVFALLLNTLGVAGIGVALLLLARRRAWVLAVFASPVIVFTLGSSLDPLALALSLWAVVLALAPAPVKPRPGLAGVLIGVATFINPLALLVLLALALSGLHPPGRLAARNPQMMIATATITSAIILGADGTAISRIAHWWSDALDGGSFASILAMARLGDGGAWAGVWIVASGLVVLLTTASLIYVRAGGLDPAVTACLLIGGCLVLAPGLMPWDSLWILPFLALAVSRWWVLIVWSLAEAVFAAASHLGDITGSAADEGLDPAFIALFALLRLLALIMVIVFAGENLHRRRVRGRLRPRETERSRTEPAAPEVGTTSAGTTSVSTASAGSTSAATTSATEGPSPRVGGHGEPT